MRDLKDFHASSVLWVNRDLWRVVSRVVTWSGDRVLGGGVGRSECLDGGVLRAKIEGWRKE